MRRRPGRAVEALSVWRGRRAAVASLVAAALSLARTVSAATVQSSGPYWVRDDYLDTGGVNLAATTALVDTADPGTVQLPYAPAQVAFDPRGTYALVANGGGVSAYVFNGREVQTVSDWNLDALPATGVAWVDGGSAFAISTPSRVVVYGLNQAGGAVAAAQVAAGGVIGLAAGPSALPSAVLAATPGGARLYEADGTTLLSVSGGPAGMAGNLGVASTIDGSVAATWQPDAVQIWTWDGSRYLPAPTWDPPAPPRADGPVVGVAFFPQGGGYWLLTRQGQLLAYAYGPTGVWLLSGWSVSAGVNPAPPIAAAAGWTSAAAAVLYPTGWVYEDQANGRFGEDSDRSLSVQTWMAYASQGVLESVIFPVNHLVTEVRLEDADCTAGQAPPNCTRMPGVPPGTSVTYAVSTDGCRTWIPARAFSNVAVPPGDRLCYGLRLTTTQPTVTPTVDVTNLYEIAQRRTDASVASLLCVPGSC